MDLVNPFMDEPASSPDVFGPPSEPFYHHPTPPPRAHSCFSLRYRPYSDDYGNVPMPSHPLMLYPSPLPSTLRTPISQRFYHPSPIPHTPFQPQETQSTRPSNSIHQPVGIEVKKIYRPLYYVCFSKICFEQTQSHLYKKEIFFFFTVSLKKKIIIFL